MKTIKEMTQAGGVARWRGKTKVEKSAHCRMMAEKRWKDVPLEERVESTKKACEAMRAARWPHHRPVDLP